MFRRALDAVGQRPFISVRSYTPQIMRSTYSPTPNIGQPTWAAYEEPISKYVNNAGYLPVTLGQELGGYLVLKKLGWGAYSTVWLAQRRHDETFAALKVMTGLASHLPQLHELEYLQRMRSGSPSHPGYTHVAQLVDHFRYTKDPSRIHLCLVLDPLSQSLHSFSKRCSNSRLPSGLARHVVRQVVEGLDFLHNECNIIHTDVKPDNIMLDISPADIRAFLAFNAEAPTSTTVLPDGEEVTRPQSTPIPIPLPAGDVNKYESWKHVNAKLADVGVSCWADKVDEHFTELIQSPALRAPEVCIGAEWGKPADIWSIGCLAYQLLMGESLIKEDSKDQAVPFYHAAFFGDLPLEMQQRGVYSNYFYNEDGSLKMDLDRRWSVEKLIRRSPPADADLLIDFLNYTFALDPEQRPTARELLEHEWLRPK